MKKKVIVTLCSIAAFVGIAAGAYFITKALEPKATSTIEFLVSGHEWQKQGEETVVWTFENEGKCRVTTNSTETFDCTWQVDGDTLKIQTKWLRDLEDEFEISINATEGTFTIVSKADGKTSTFSKKL